ncbi:MAG TPA: UbiX family flavin prenyltransferase, partial [Hyphomicrobiales bacterium]|nr:UbiX family flavin prenyltransferase [Hyphomicrobiales bacterium]
MSPRRIVVAVTGASGAAIGMRVVGLLAAHGGFETHLVVTKAGERTLAHEADPGALAALERAVARRHAVDDIGAALASGSFRTEAMIVAPCSIRALSAIATSNATDLVARAADVHLKERRRLVLLVREAPLHLGHLR